MVGCCIMSWLVVVAGLGGFLAAQNKNLLKNVLCCLQVQSIICFCLSNIYFTCRGQTMSHHFPDPDPILTQVYGTISWYGITRPQQATGLDAWASRVKCPARFVSHLHEICIYIWVVYSLCFFCCLFITVTWWYVWCFEWASGNQEEVQACLVTSWLFIISCYSLYKTTLGLLCSWFENNPHFHKYSMDFHV